MDSAWHDAHNAHLYEDYAQTYSIYRETATKLVELANVTVGMTIVDLACGTGIVIEQLQAKLAGTGNIIGVDLSQAMLDIARAKFPALQFLQSPAERLHEVLPAGSADLLLCNSAFWQMKPRVTATVVQQILKPDAKFLFNVPATMQMSMSHPDFTHSLLHLMYEIAREEYSYVPPPSQRRLTFSTAEITDLLRNADFTHITQETVHFTKTMQDIYTFYKIPIMTQGQFPDLDYATRAEIVEKAYQRYDTAQSEDIAWTYYSAQKRVA